MAWKWFVQKEDVIEGPLTSDEVQLRLQGMEFLPHHLVWGPGFESWQNLKSWIKELPELGTSVRNGVPDDSWHYALGGQSHGPLTREVLLEELKKLPNANDVMLWTQGMKEWAPLYEFHDLVTILGVNKRQFPRADVTGKAIIKLNGVTMIAPLLSISEGGAGIELESGLVAGQSVNLEMKSPAFRESLHAKAEVRYAGGGVVGIKFTSISVETKSAIIQFIKSNQLQFFIKAA